MHQLQDIGTADIRIRGKGLGPLRSTTVDVQDKLEGKSKRYGTQYTNYSRGKTGYTASDSTDQRMSSCFVVNHHHT